MIASFLIQTLNGLASASLLFLVALGLTLIFGVTRIVNFAHGSFFMLGAYLAVTLYDRLGGGVLGFWGGALLAALVVGVLGALIEIADPAPHLPRARAPAAHHHLRRRARPQGRGALSVGAGRHPRAARAGPDGRRLDPRQAVPDYDLLLLVLGPLVGLGVWLLLKRTDWGTRVRAATEDRDMAAALGINQALMFTGVFALGSLLAGLAGALALPREPANHAMDLTIIADVFVVTVVGGLGSLPGAYVAAVIISVVKAWCIGLGETRIFGVAFSFSKLTLVAEFIVMAVVLVIRPWGLFGTPQAPQRVAAASILPLPMPDLRRAWPLAMVALVLIALPLVADRYTIVLATDIVIFALFAASLGLIMGAGGMASFGHAAYFGAGAYAAAVAAKAGAPFLVAVPAGVAFAGGLAVGVRLVLRAALRRLARHADARVRADRLGHRLPVGRRHRRQQRPDRRLAAGAAVRQDRLLFRDARRSPASRSGSSGAPSTRRSATCCGPRATPAFAPRRSASTCASSNGAPSLRPARLRGSPARSTSSRRARCRRTRSSIPRSVDALVMVLIGGVQTLVGPVVGAFVFIMLQDWIMRATPYWQAVLGATLILITVLFPQGIVGTLRQWRARREETP